MWWYIVRHGQPLILRKMKNKKDIVKAVNATGTKNIADVCKKLDCKMVYISTDYVSTDRERKHGNRIAKITNL